MVEPSDAVFNRVACGQQQHGDADTVLPKLRQDLKAIAVGQHDVEQNQVKGLRVDQEEAVFSGRGHRDDVALAFQAAAQRVRQLGFVFNKKHVHSTYIPRSTRRWRIK